MSTPYVHIMYTQCTAWSMHSPLMIYVQHTPYVHPFEGPYLQRLNILSHKWKILENGCYIFRVSNVINFFLSKVTGFFKYLMFLTYFFNHSFLQLHFYFNLNVFSPFIFTITFLFHFKCFFIIHFTTLIFSLCFYMSS